MQQKPADNNINFFRTRIVYYLRTKSRPALIVYTQDLLGKISHSPSSTHTQQKYKLLGYITIYMPGTPV